jgi:pyruvate/2-oxoacid:ferredoxin oxidoreductase alpha subunit
VAAQRQLKEAEQHLLWPITQDRIRAIAAHLNAQVVVVDRQLAASDLARGPETIFQNEKYVVVRVPPERLAADGAKPASVRR